MLGPLLKNSKSEKLLGTIIDHFFEVNEHISKLYKFNNYMLLHLFQVIEIKSNLD